MVCICTPMTVGAHVYVGAHVGMYVVLRLMLSVFLYFSIPNTFNQGLSLYLELYISASLTGQPVPGFPSYLTSAGITGRSP